MWRGRAFDVPPLEAFDDPGARRYSANQPNPSMASMQSKAFYAVATGDNPTFQKMIDAGWPIEKIKDTAGKTVLHVAAQKGNSAAITLMVKAGNPIDPITTWKETPLHLAVLSATGEPVVRLRVDKVALPEAKRAKASEAAA